MDVLDKSPDWVLVQSFLAVAETGSLSAAAAQLGQSQPTLGRHIKALETSFNVALFRRHARGLTLTETGEALLPMAETMRDAMQRLSLTAQGRAPTANAIVRITASVYISHFVLPPLLARLRAEAPHIHIILVASDETENLLFREADIAIRMYRPEQLDVVTSHVTDIQTGVFAAKTYINRRGMPTSQEDLLRHDLIGYDTNDLILRNVRAQGWSFSADDFAVRCDNQSAYWHLVRSGCGIGFGQRSVGQSDPALQELELGIDMPSLPVWLTAHEALRQSPNLRQVWDILRSDLAQIH